MTGIGMPRTHNRMPRMSNLKRCETADIVVLRGGSMADGITIRCISQSLPHAAKD